MTKLENLVKSGLAYNYEKVFWPWRKRSSFPLCQCGATEFERWIFLL